jgi:hypothetical protein
MQTSLSEEQSKGAGDNIVAERMVEKISSRLQAKTKSRPKEKKTSLSGSGDGDFDRRQFSSENSEAETVSADDTQVVSVQIWRRQSSAGRDGCRRQFSCVPCEDRGHKRQREAVQIAQREEKIAAEGSALLTTCQSHEDSGQNRLAWN